MTEGDTAEELGASLDRYERASMAYERMGKATRDDAKTREMRKAAIAELAEARRWIFELFGGARLNPRWREHAGDAGLGDMVAHVLREFDAGRCDGLRFDCFNLSEVDRVRELMTKRPDVPFSTTRIAPGRDAS